MRKVAEAVALTDPDASYSAMIRAIEAEYQREARRRKRSKAQKASTPKGHSTRATMVAAVTINKPTKPNGKADVSNLSFPIPFYLARKKRFCGDELGDRQTFTYHKKYCAHQNTTPRVHCAKCGANDHVTDAHQSSRKERAVKPRLRKSKIGARKCRSEPQPDSGESAVAEDPDQTNSDSERKHLTLFSRPLQTMCGMISDNFIDFGVDSFAGESMVTSIGILTDPEEHEYEFTVANKQSPILLSTHRGKLILECVLKDNTTAILDFGFAYYSKDLPINLLSDKSIAFANLVTRLGPKSDVLHSYNGSTSIKVVRCEGMPYIRVRRPCKTEVEEHWKNESTIDVLDAFSNTPVMLCGPRITSVRGWNVPLLVPPLDRSTHRDLRTESTNSAMENKIKTGLDRFTHTEICELKVQIVRWEIRSRRGSGGG